MTRFSKKEQFRGVSYKYLAPLYKKCRFRKYCSFRIISGNSKFAAIRFERKSKIRSTICCHYTTKVIDRSAGQISFCCKTNTCTNCFQCAKEFIMLFCNCGFIASLQLLFWRNPIINNVFTKTIKHTFSGKHTFVIKLGKFVRSFRSLFLKQKIIEIGPWHVSSEFE